MSLREVGASGFVVLALSTFLPIVISSFLLKMRKVGRGGGGEKAPDPQAPPLVSPLMLVS